MIYPDELALPNTNMQYSGPLIWTVVIDDLSATVILLLLLILVLVVTLMERVIQDPPLTLPPIGEMAVGSNAGNTWKSNGLLVTPALEDTTNRYSPTASVDGNKHLNC